MGRTVLVILLHIFSSAVVSKNITRTRVLEGHVLKDRLLPGYDVVRYFVWIGFTLAVIPTGKWIEQNEACGGALLTPRVVQTAGHCFTNRREPADGDGFMWCYRNDLRYEVVAGSAEVNSAFKPISITKYSIHPKCAGYGGFITHDFALVTLEDEVKLSPTIMTAPVYPLKEMAEMWVDFVGNRAVCLMLGFGRYIREDIATKSPVLRHGWMVLQSYIQCYEKFNSFQTSKTPSLVEYQAVNTWSCLEKFNRTIGSEGDSGSPITCDNVYFAVHSQGGVTINDVVFNPYANSQEWRDKMNVDTDISADEAKLTYTIPQDVYHKGGSAPPNKYFAAIPSSGRSATKRFSILPGLFIMFAAQLEGFRTFRAFSKMSNYPDPEVIK